MKKLLTFLALVFLFSPLKALELELDGDSGLPFRKPTSITEIPVDDTTLRGLIFDVVDNIWLDIHTNQDFIGRTKGIARKGGVAPERMAKMLESIVREGLREMRTAEKGTAEYSAAAIKIVEPVEMLSVFHGPDTPALLEECARLGKAGSISAMKTYVDIVGAVESIPLLGEVLIGEVVAKGGKNLNPHRGGLFESLQKSAQKLESEKKEDDALKVYIFLLGLAFIEYEPNTAVKLDRILCAGLPDYATSFDREKIIGKFADLPMNTDYFKNLRSEIRKVPANNRRDYNKQPLRVPKESEKEIKIMLPSR